MQLRCLFALSFLFATLASHAQKNDDDDDAFVARRNAFLQKNFTNFVPVKFLSPTNKTEAAFQRFKVNDHLIGEFEGRYYSGIRFTVPEWIDGDFQWMFMHLPRGAQKGKRVSFQWYILPERGEMIGFADYTPGKLANYPELRKRFPSTTDAYAQTLKRDDLKPGQSYALWFGHRQAVVPDIAFALTIKSEHGQKQFGAIPAR
jgi:hypothetical protein